MAARRSSSPSGARAARRGRGAGNGNPVPATRRTGAENAIGEIQRLRILTAMASACRELGAGRVTVADVVARAGVSRRTFYEIYRDRDDCLAAALEEGLRRACEQALPAYEAQERWREAVRAGLEAFLAFLDADRTFGSLLVIDWLGAGENALARRAEVLSAIVKEVEKGRRAPAARRSASASAAEGAVGAVLAILHARLLAGPQTPVGPLAGELAGLIVLPYLGAAVAGREAARRPVSREPPPATDGDLLADLDLRLTHRTLLVLRALAEGGGRRDGMSNRDLAEAAGITDQGQASRLLTRLAGRGLAVNLHKHARWSGATNAWRLTPKGARVERATRPGRLAGEPVADAPRRRDA